MRHLAALTLVAALTAAVPAAPAAKRKPLATAKVVECVSGTSPTDGRAIFRGSMRKVRGTERMWMKFMLQEKVGGLPFRTVKAPGLGIWRKSRRGVRRFAIRQRVLALVDGSAYRVAIRYRWYDADGHRLRRARRRSGSCRQGGSLPNLRVTRIGGRREGSTFRYAIDVHNRGRAASQPTSVAVSVDGDPVDTPAVGPLAPGQVRRVFVNGPLCSTSVKAQVDPSDIVRESNETDNSRLGACPQ